jgi:hypothetical protein
MRSIMIAAAFVAMASTPAAAEGAKSAASVATDAAAQTPVEGRAAARSLYICDASDLTRRSFARQHGAVEFVKADQAAAKGEAWDAPRCITRSEYQRLRQMLARNER